MTLVGICRRIIRNQGFLGVAGFRMGVGGMEVITGCKKPRSLPTWMLGQVYKWLATWGITHE